MSSQRRMSSRRKFEDYQFNHDQDRSPIIVDDSGGVMRHVFTYPYIVPIYYNHGKYDLNKLNSDFHISSTTQTTTTTEEESANEEESLMTTKNPWDMVILPDSFYDNIHSMFSLKNYQQFVNQREARVVDTISTTPEYEMDKETNIGNKNGQIIAKRFLNTYFSD